MIKLVLILLLFPLMSFSGQVITPSEAQGLMISKITFSGLNRTNAEVVRRELLLAEGSVFEEARYRESITRLKNLLIFSGIESRLTESQGKVFLEINFEERWTIIPIVRFGGGGGTSYYILGTYDINLFGRYLETGGQYENLGGTHNGVVWFRNPRFLDKRIRLGGDIWKVTRNRSLYDPKGTVEGGYTLERTRFNFFADKEVHRFLTLGGGVEVDLDRLSERFISSQEKNANQLTRYQFGDYAETHLVRFILKLGRINTDVYLFDGFESQFVIDRALDFLGAGVSFTKYEIENRFFKTLPMNSNFAFRLKFGHMGKHYFQHLFYIGGLDAVRGFSDGQFRTTNYWFSNIEYRIPSLKTKWFVLFHNFFLDAGKADDNFTGLVDADNPLFYSSGVGIRLVLPRIYRFALRADYAYGFGTSGGPGLAWGTQQFF
jgi:outer membrane protein assembly factor BamA